ncbi:MAG: tetratricopeptide repeat protein [Candidatus Microgenomates bacterium]|jgi:tetratricopeptide (TPR) repeat protein
MDTSPAQLAINLALSGNWTEAVKINLEILSENSEDVDALNRLARAYTELGKISQAREMAKKVLKIDAVNPIALKVIEKLKTAKKVSGEFSTPTSSESFLEEPGKTRLITLLNLGDSSVFTNLDPGEEVKLVSYPHKVTINTLDGKHIGSLPDDIAARLRNLIKAGNKYQTLIKSVEPKEVAVFIREIERGPKAPDISSFPTEKIDYVAFTSPELIHKDTPIVEATEETPE